MKWKCTEDRHPKVYKNEKKNHNPNPSSSHKIDFLPLEFLLCELWTEKWLKSFYFW